MDDALILKMSDCAQEHATVKLKNGKTLKGFVDTYESRYDNDGEASICFAEENGEMLIIEEHEIEDIMLSE